MFESEFTEPNRRFSSFATTRPLSMLHRAKKAEGWRAAGGARRTGVGAVACATPSRMKHTPAPAVQWVRGPISLPFCGRKPLWHDDQGAFVFSDDNRIWNPVNQMGLPSSRLRLWNSFIGHRVYPRTKRRRLAWVYYRGCLAT